MSPLHIERMTVSRLLYWHGLAFAVLSDRDEAIAEFVAQKRLTRGQ